MKQREKLTCTKYRYNPVKLFRRRMQNYATLCDTIIQHYATLYNPRRYVTACRRERPFLRR